MLQIFITTFAPVLWGGVLALLLNVPLCATERHLHAFRTHTRRAIGLALVGVWLVAVLFLALWLLLPQLVMALANIGVALPQLQQQWKNYGEWFIGIFPAKEVLFYQNVFNATQLEGAMEQLFSDLMSVGMAAAGHTAQQLARFAISLVLAVYFLAEKESLGHKAMLVARAIFGDVRGGKLIRVAKHAGNVFSSFLRGQCIEACILAGLFVLVLFAFDIPYVLAVATLIGITSFVPIFGSIAGGLLGFLLVLGAQPEKSIVFLLLFVLVQQFENNVIYPRVVGSRVGLPPLWVMIAVVVGGGLCGISGLLLGIPAMSVIYQLGGEWVHARTQTAQEKHDAE